MTTLILAVAVALTAAGCGVRPSGAAPAVGSAAAARDHLDRLTVSAHASTSGYSRSRFPHWRSAGANCDIRDVVLRRDGTGVTVQGCNVTNGNWRSEYDNKTYHSPTEIDIDHMVPLANAWRSGASTWDDTRRGDFANDLDRPQLIAVSASTNRSKGDQDPSLWRPDNRDYWCTYGQSWITVKSHWQLAVTSDEKTALSDMLDTCQ